MSYVKRTGKKSEPYIKKIVLMNSSSIEVITAIPNSNTSTLFLQIPDDEFIHGKYIESELDTILNTSKETFIEPSTNRMKFLVDITLRPDLAERVLNTLLIIQKEMNNKFDIIVSENCRDMISGSSFYKENYSKLQSEREEKVKSDNEQNLYNTLLNMAVSREIPGVEIKIYLYFLGNYIKALTLDDNKYLQLSYDQVVRAIGDPLSIDRKIIIKTIDRLKKKKIISIIPPTNVQHFKSNNIHKIKYDKKENEYDIGDLFIALAKDPEVTEDALRFFLYVYIKIIQENYDDFGSEIATTMCYATRPDFICKALNISMDKYHELKQFLTQHQLLAYQEIEDKVVWLPESHLQWSLKSLGPNLHDVEKIQEPIISIGNDVYDKLFKTHDPVQKPKP